MAYLKTLEECESFVRIAVFQQSQLCYPQVSIQEALQVNTKEEYLATVRMLNALINARNELEHLPYDSINICNMILYRVQFATIVVHITNLYDILIIVLGL